MSKLGWLVGLVVLVGCADEPEADLPDYSQRTHIDTPEQVSPHQPTQLAPQAPDAGQGHLPLAPTQDQPDTGAQAPETTDAGVPPTLAPDAGSVQPDAQVVSADASTVSPDGGVVSQDAQVVQPDAASTVPSTDAGVAPVECMDVLKLDTQRALYIGPIDCQGTTKAPACTGAMTPSNTPLVGASGNWCDSTATVLAGAGYSFRIWAATQTGPRTIMARSDTCVRVIIGGHCRLTNNFVRASDPPGRPRPDLAVARPNTGTSSTSLDDGWVEIDVSMPGELGCSLSCGELPL
jgi:hypothetical protein